MSISSTASANSVSANYVQNNANQQQSTLSTTLINANSNTTGITNAVATASGITSVAFMDELVKEYLLFRGCNATFKSFEHDLKQDKDRAFKADKIVEQLFSYINSYDLVNLIEYWSYLDQKYFSHLTFKTLNGVPLSRKYELFLFRYYLVHSVQTNKTDKVNEFLEKLAPFIQTQPEWKDWFCLPFIKNPEENPTFSIYFNQKWIDTFAVSLQNFISIVFQSVQFPRLLLFDEDAYWNPSGGTAKSSSSFERSLLYNTDDVSNQELTDEFQLMQTESTSTSSTQVPSSGSSFISILKNFGTSTTKQKSTLQQQMKTSASSSQLSQQASKAMPIVSPLENLVKNIKTKNETKVEEESVGKSIGSEPTTPRPAELTVRPYTILNEEVYSEHDGPVVHCRHSPDGNYIASIDANGTLKIWNINQNLETYNTLIQKSAILSMEWDKRNSGVLYLGNSSSTVKAYNINEKKITHEMTFNKLYPHVNQICSFASSDKLLIILSKNDVVVREHGQLVVCRTNNNSLQFEKTIELDAYYSQCVVPYLSNYALLGCTDGYIRVFDCNLNDIVNSRKCHASNILNITINKGQTKLYSLSNDNQIKIWLLNNTFLSSASVQNALNTFKIPFDLRTVYNNTISSFMALDLCENLVFLASKNGILLFKMLSSLLKLSNLTNTDNDLEEVEFFSCNNNTVTTIELWNSTYSCILLAGCSNGKIHIFRLLNN